VLDTARGLFKSRGVDGVSMYEIGRAAGVGQGTLYRRFEHKGALCSALLAEQVEDFYEETWERVETEGRPALARLAWFLDRLAGFNERNADLLGAIRDSAGGQRRVEMYRNPFYGWLRGTVVALLRRAEEEGELGPDLDLECVADTLLAALNIDLYLYQRRELGMGRGRIMRSLQGLLDGLGGNST
ncbi:MAG: TetR/AcrR family transcriptional regulator, partial [Actinomycetota bacterium]|nr:TetR/AcrR family transcriptional regulator [Actinomycetota bacterium]